MKNLDIFIHIFRPKSKLKEVVPGEIDVIDRIEGFGKCVRKKSLIELLRTRKSKTSDLSIVDSM